MLEKLEKEQYRSDEIEGQLKLGDTSLMFDRRASATQVIFLYSLNNKCEKDARLSARVKLINVCSIS